MNRVFNVRITSPIRFGLAIRPPLYPGTAEQPPTLDVRQHLSRDVFQHQSVRFGAEIQPATGTTTMIWLKILKSLGPNPPTDSQKKRIKRIANRLISSLTVKMGNNDRTNHILACIQVYGDTEQNPYRAVAQNPRAMDVASKIPERQLQILELASLGWDRSLIGAALGISARTINNYLSGQPFSLYTTLDVQNMPAALSLAMEHGFLPFNNLYDTEVIQRLATLSLRQLEVLDLLLSNIDSKTIAGSLFIALKTVKNHKGAICKVLLPDQPGSRKALITQYHPYLDEIWKLIEQKRAK